MFAVTSNDSDGCESDSMIEDFVSIEKDLFLQLGLHFRSPYHLELARFVYRLCAYHLCVPMRKDIFTESIG